MFPGIDWKCTDYVLNWFRGQPRAGIPVFIACLLTDQSSLFPLICVMAPMNQCHRCWEHLLSTLAPWATPLTDTNYKISAPWGEIAQALPHGPKGLWSGQCVHVSMSVIRQQYSYKFASSAFINICLSISIPWLLFAHQLHEGRVKWKLMTCNLVFRACAKLYSCSERGWFIRLCQKTNGN